MNNGEFGFGEFLICAIVFLVCIFLVIMYANKVSREKDIFSSNTIPTYNNII